MTPDRFRERVEPRLSLRRRRAGWLLLALALLPYGLYRHFTDSEYIRAAAVDLLEKTTGGRVEIEAARFSLFSGIRLENVSVFAPPDPDFVVAGFDGRPGPELPPILTCGGVLLLHEPWALLFGKLRVREIIAAQPTLTLVYHAESNRYNWNLLFKGVRPVAPRGGASARRPPIRLRTAQVTLVRIEGREAEFARPYRLDVDAWPDPRSSTAYAIDSRLYAEVPQRTRGVFDPFDRRVVDTPFVSYASIRQLLPIPYRDFLDRFALTGQFRARRIDYGPQSPQPQRIIVEFADAAFSPKLPWPVEPVTQPADPTQRQAYTPLQFEHLSGRVSLSGVEAEIELLGTLNGAACNLSGHVSRIDLPAGETGLDLKLTCRGLVLPEGDPRRAIIDDDSLPRNLRNFFVDFEPHGKIDLAANLRREPGRDMPPHIEAVLTADGAEAWYKEFRYRLTDMTGVVRIADDGTHIDNVVGRHGDTVVRINGWLKDPHWWTDFDLNFESDGVTLDDDLYRALPARYRDVWSAWRPSGVTAAKVRLRREGGRPPDMPGHWNTTVDLSFRDVDLAHYSFPYRFHGVRGGVLITHERCVLSGLSGRHDGGSIEADGEFEFHGPKAGAMEIRLRADDLPLNATLWDALPPAARQRVLDLHLAGAAGVRGRIYREPDSDAVMYDLSATLADARLCSQQVPYPLTDVQGDVRLTRDAVRLENVRGRRGDATVQIDGEIRYTGDDYEARLAVAGRAVPLDDTLRAALPVDFRAAWARVEPGGDADLTAKVSETHRDGRTTRSYSGELSTSNGDMRYIGFPWPLEQVRARVRFDNRRIDILELRGRPIRSATSDSPATQPAVSATTAAHEDAAECEVALSGVMHLDEPGGRTQLQISGAGLRLDDATFLAALPAELAAYVSRARPAGLADATLDSFTHEPLAAGGSRWRADGTVDLRDAAGDLGMRLRDVNGRVTGRIEVEAGRVTAFDAHAELDRANADIWPLEDVQAELRIDPATSILFIDPIQATAAGGTLGGTVEIHMGAPRPRYRMLLTLSDADLTRMLSSLRPAGAPPGHERGRVYGRLALEGIVGEPATREAAGELLLDDAEVWELPITLLILQVLNLAPDKNAFHEGRVQYYLEGDLLRMARIDLHGHALSLVGAGTYDLKSRQLDLTLVAGSPQRLRIPVLTDLLESALRELMEVRVRGTLSNPSIRAAPFRGGKAFLEELFGEKTPRRVLERP